ncbi:kinase-like protein [Metschnikowia bicuspidata var. bicuspidata NRRL YB-4993]|uniref:Kinase-like protein n=1 Tax=Metschnikowia bicuspidata var. bicuspidata NRRL YB-4993 TaxID=869754 RepID=A0A1A0HI65_9ASCO|nr:kinase-like protein [Metschnikowia bicuspidata var. bicuspidata NRRL YB-4993]OBA23695.1 kinase-like protein [Metschnikowia bicuspidata var. bicuspidata NRRL YB-4993]
MYKKLDSVYSGPFCDVYRGESETGAAVALKVVDLDFIRKPHDFRNEIKIIKSLHHRNIAQFLDTYALGEDHYLVMPFYEKTLADVMKHFTKKRMKFNLENPLNTEVASTSVFPLDSANAIVWGLADAVQYVHQQGIIHRDIKPSNVFFRSLEDLENPILGDFGISYNVMSPSLEEPLDQKFTDIATGYYKAPELCFAVCDYGSEVDLWSLGILISCLYSRDGEPANRVAQQNDNERAPELNDFVLLQGTFEAFGTPTVADKNSELYWPALADPWYHFVDFNFTKYDRKPTRELLPRCENARITQLFEGLTRYDKREIISLDSDRGNRAE